jgi:hypothetical protein
MATTYQWNVVQMDRNIADGFVTTVHYTVSAVDGEFTASTYGTVGFTKEEMDYVPFEKLTPEQVIGWVKDSLGQETVEEALATQIDAQQNPVSESGLPWAK